MFKMSKGKKPKNKLEPVRDDGRRVTGVATELPFAVRLGLKCGAFVLALGVLCFGGKVLFTQYYHRAPGVFVMSDVRRDVTITTGKTLTPDFFHDVWGLKDNMNPFSLSIQDERKKLMAFAPNIKDMKIVRYLPDKMTISVTEREPIARIGVGTDGRVVDEEGIVFSRYAGVGGLPLITGSDTLLLTHPGDRLRDIPMAAVRLVYSMQRPEVRLRLLEVRVVRDDYLNLTMSDHRQAKFAWGGMEDEDKDTVRQMQKHFDELAGYMDSELGKHCLVWEARVPGRIVAEVPGLQL